MDNAIRMTTDILQKTIHELKSLGASSEALETAVHRYEEAKDDRTRLKTGSYLRGVLDQSIELAKKRVDRDKQARVIELYEALAAHVPADPELT